MFIQIGTGSRVGHVAIAAWMDGVLNVCEAVSDKHCDGLWPAPYGVICTEFQHWMQLAVQVNYLASFLPLAPEYRAVFDEEAAVTFIKSVLGGCSLSLSLLNRCVDIYRCRAAVR